MKRIGIVLTHLDPTRTGGAESYCRALVRGLADADTPIRFKLFVGKAHEPMPTSRSIELIECDVDPRSRRRRILWEQTRLTGMLRRHDLSLVHFPYGTPPIGFDGPGVVTIHDTVRFQSVGRMPPIERWYRDRIERAVIRHGHAVIMVSHADLSVFRQHTGLAEGVGHVVPLGVDEDTIVEHPLAVGERENELLWVGRAYPSKNLIFLLRVYAVLRSAMQDCPRLRLIGIGPAEARPLQYEAQRLGIADALTLDPPVRQETLSTFYREARLLVYPSLHESFGLPVAEALAAGTPVVCSSIPAFVELYADVVIPCAPGDTAAWVSAIRRLLEDDGLYQSRAEAGVQHVRERYVWDRTVGRTLDVYQKLLASDPGG